MFEIKRGLTESGYDKEQLEKGIKELKWYIDQVNQGGKIPGGIFKPGSGESGEVMIDSKTRLRWDTPGGKGVILYVFERSSGNGWQALESNDVNESIKLMRQAIEMKRANALPSSGTSFDQTSDPGVSVPGAPILSVAPNPGTAAPSVAPTPWVKILAAVGTAGIVTYHVAKVSAVGTASFVKNASIAIVKTSTGVTLPCVPTKILNPGHPTT